MSIKSQRTNRVTVNFCHTHTHTHKYLHVLKYIYMSALLKQNLIQENAIYSKVFISVLLSTVCYKHWQNLI